MHKFLLNLKWLKDLRYTLKNFNNVLEEFTVFKFFLNFIVTPKRCYGDSGRWYSKKKDKRRGGTDQFSHNI